MKNLFILFWAILTFTACSPIKTRNSVALNQGVEGYIYQVSGNQMPSPNIPPQKPQTLSTTVYIYESTNLKDVEPINHSSFYKTIKTKLIATAQSDSLGYFSKKLQPGKYSLFIKLNEVFYANLFDSENNIAPFSVESNKSTKVTFKVDANATY